MISITVRRRCMLLPLVFLFCLGFSPVHEQAYAGVAPKNLQVIDLDRAPGGAELTKARAAFRDGSAIVRIIGATRNDLARLLQVQMPAVDATTKRSTNPISPTDKTGQKLKLQAVAVYLDGDGTVRSLQTFAPTNSDESTWRQLVEKWTTKELSRAAGAVFGDPSPPAQAWTTIAVNTVQASVNEGFEENNISVYRLNTTDPTSDYYMVYTVPTVQPSWNGSCDGFSTCDWHTYSRHLETNLTQAGLTEHGPTGTIGTSSVSFTIGGSVGPTGPGASASFGVSWTQPDVTTTDLSTTSAGIWDENFGNALIRCNPAGGRVPPTSSGTFFSRQGTIFRVPGGTTSIQPVVEADAEFCSYAVDSVGFDYSNIKMTFTAVLGSPILSGYPISMTIPAGGTSPLLVNAYIANSAQGLQWNITSNHATSWLSVPSGNSFSASEVIPVSVTQGTPVGSQGTLSLDTIPPFAASSVTSGPILINVTVGTPKQTSRAGVLLIGGEDAFRKIAGTIFYDMTSKQAVAVGQPSVPRYLHTATRLNSGKILVVGGASSIVSGATSTEDPGGGITSLTAVSELYDPASASFNLTGSLAVARFLHSAVLLPDGKVLIVGGEDQQHAAAQTAELYDPASGTFTPAGTMHLPRKGTSTATLISGTGEPARVLVYGGTVAGSPTSTEIWSQASNSFSPGPEMQPNQPFFPTPVESSRGQFEVVGGLDSIDSVTSHTQILTIPSAFRDGPSLNLPRQNHTLTALAGGSGVLVTGGSSEQTASGVTAEIKNGTQWALLSGKGACPGSPGCMVAARSLHTATLLPDGTVFLAGGIDANGNAQGSTEIFDPTTGQFTPGPILPTQSRQTANFISTSDVSLTAGPSPTFSGQKVTMVAVVTVAFGTASGKVAFFDNGSAIATVAVNTARATFETSTLAVGSHILTAQYLGDSVNLPTTSNPATVVVETNSTIVSLTSSLNPSVVGQVVRFATEVSSTSGVATGSVSFKDGTTLLEVVPLSGGAASYRTPSLAAGDHLITATYGGDASHAPAISPSVIQKVLQATTTTTLTVNSATVTYGKTLSLTAVVTGTRPITGSVLFGDGGTSLGSVKLTNSRATLPVSSLSAGAHSLTATYTGDSSHATSTSTMVPATVTQASPSVTMTSSKNPSSFGQPITFVAKIAGGGTAGPSGTVLFSDENTPIGPPQPIVNGTANVSTSSLSAGQHFISAAYSGDTNYTSAASPALKQVVSGAATQTTLQSNLNPSEVGQAVTFAIVVSAQQGTPTGSVRILDGGSQLSQITLGNGTGAFSTPSLTVGTHAITAVYSGDSTNAGSTSLPLAQVVNKAVTTTTLSATPSSTVFGQPLALVALVTAPSATGTVAFTDRGNPIGSAAVLNGKATLQIASLAVGAHIVTASYRGNSSHGTSQSAPVPVTVQMGVTTVQLASALNPSRTGQPVTLTATVSSPFGSPTGSVTFTDGAVQIGTPQRIGSGTASVRTSTLTAGSHIIAASYSGDRNYTASVSPNLTQTVTPSQFPVTLTLTSIPNPSVSGGAVIFTAVATSSSGPVPTGSVTLSEGAKIYGSGTLVAGSALISVPSIPVGIHEIRGTYGGDESHAGATSPPVVQRVNAEDALTR